MMAIGQATGNIVFPNSNGPIHMFSPKSARVEGRPHPPTGNPGSDCITSILNEADDENYLNKLPVTLNSSPSDTRFVDIYFFCIQCVSLQNSLNSGQCNLCKRLRFKCILCEVIH